MMWLLLIGVVLPSLAFAEDLPYVQWLSCHDGDTCEFNVMQLVPLPPVYGSNIGVRLSGIDTPEKNGKCAKEKALALAAKEFLISRMQGAMVVLKNVSRDKYFRLESIIEANGVNLNQLLIQKGYAVAYNGTGPRKDWCH